MIEYMTPNEKKYFYLGVIFGIFMGIIIASILFVIVI
jgi:hypothetical protein